MEQSDHHRQRFEAAVEAHADSMFRVAFRLSGSRYQAEEIVQETFAGAWKNIEQLRDPSRIKSWLFGVLKNQFYKSLTKAKRNPSQELSCAVEPLQREPNNVQQRVQEAIAMLDDDQRFPLLLVSMEGWTTEEAAELLGIPKGTVLSRLHRGRQRLKEILTREFEIDVTRE